MNTPMSACPSSGERKYTTNLAELSDVTDPLALQGPKVLGNSAILEIDNTGERLVEQRADRGDGEVTSFGLVTVSIEPSTT
jgi:hypothetical protein